MPEPSPMAVDAARLAFAAVNGDIRPAEELARRFADRAARADADAGELVALYRDLRDLFLDAGAMTAWANKSGVDLEEVIRRDGLTPEQRAEVEAHRALFDRLEAELREEK